MCRWPMVVVPVRADQRTTLAPACKRPRRQMWHRHPTRSRKIPHPQQNLPKIHQKHTSSTEKNHQKSIMFQYFHVFSTFLGIFHIFPGIPGVFRLFPTFFPTFHRPGRGQPHGHAGAQPDAALQLHRRTEAHGEFPPGRRGEAPRR